MKKTFIAAIAATLLATGCNNGNQTDKTADSDTASKTEIGVSDMAYVKADSLFLQSDLYLKDGVALQEKLDKAQQGWAKKEQSLQYEATQLQEKYQKGLITSVQAAQTQESIEKRIQNYQQSAQKEAAALDEENFVLQNRFNEYVRQAIAEINADGKYKLIFNSAALLDGAPALDITQELLKIVNEKYAADQNSTPKTE